MLSQHNGVVNYFLAHYFRHLFSSSQSQQQQGSSSLHSQGSHWQSGHLQAGLSQLPSSIIIFTSVMGLTLICFYEIIIHAINK